jgi:hypothetical protein
MRGTSNTSAAVFSPSMKAFSWLRAVSASAASTGSASHFGIRKVLISAVHWFGHHELAFLMTSLDQKVVMLSHIRSRSGG